MKHTSLRLLLHACATLLALAGVDAASADTLARAPGTDFRVVAWNVSRENFYLHADGFIKALRVIDADLLILDEMTATRTSAEVRHLLDQIDPANSRPWQISYGSSGHDQRAVIAVRGELAALPGFELLPYPADFVASMQRDLVHSDKLKYLASSIDAGIAAHAAVATVGGRQIAVVGVDLQCCGDTDDAWEERRRHVESAQIRARLLDALDERPVDAIIAGGDFNALRGPRPLEILQGTAGEARALKVVESRHRDGSDWTWDGRGTKFRSSHIDYVLHDRNLAPIQSVIFDPETMPVSEISGLGLARGHLIELTAHRPVVVDFKWQNLAPAAVDHSRK